MKFIDAKEEDFNEIKGKNINTLKFAMMVAIAGRHNIMAIGEPGCGKTLMFDKFPLIMPKLNNEESITVNRIFELADIHRNDKLVRPFRIPYQTSSIESMCGGGLNCRPGEISLAHNGMLFLDEAAEFRSSVLQMLRVPLESGQISLSRAGVTTIYPANFQLAMTVNPCPCGNYGQDGKICLCSDKSIELYWKKFGGPLLDRIDIRINLGSTYTMSELSNDNELSLKQIRKTIEKAQKFQYNRQGKLNGNLSPNEIEMYCQLSEDALKCLDDFATVNNISSRGRTSLIKVARTFADIDESDKIESKHMSLALALRDKTPIGY